jgi:hypothetical protein
MLREIHLSSRLIRERSGVFEGLNHLSNFVSCFSLEDVRSLHIQFSIHQHSSASIYLAALYV